MARFWQWLFMLTLRKLSVGWGACANRWWKEFRWHQYDVKVVFTDTTADEGYERTEVYDMLRRVRQAEQRMNWKCPEPTL